jgi:hypothetical protein
MMTSLVCSGRRHGTTKGGGGGVGTERNRSAVNNYVTDGNVKGRKRNQGEVLRPLHRVGQSRGVGTGAKQIPVVFRYITIYLMRIFNFI